MHRSPLLFKSRLTDACIASLSVQAEQVIEEDNMLEAFNIIEQYCNRLIEHAKQLDKPEYVHSLHPKI